MKNFFIIIFLVLFISNSNLYAQNAKGDSSNEYVTTPVNISFVPSISIGDILTEATGKKLHVKGVSLGIIGTEGDKLSGLDLAYIFSIYREDISGVQGSGIFSEVKGSFQGVQSAGIFNKVGSDFKGAQGAGIFNHVVKNFSGVQGSGIFNAIEGYFKGAQGAGIFNAVDGEFRGVQGAGIFNAVDGEFHGAQGAGIFNAVKSNLHGIQAAGIINAAEMNLHGVQAAGIINIAESNFNGVQAAGIINVAETSFKGVQAAGIINVVGKFESGLQLGMINVADEHSGVPIGIVTLVKNIPFRYDIWTDETLMLNIGLRSGNVKWYNVALLGAQVHKDVIRWGIGAGFGRKLSIKHNLNLDVGIQGHWLRRDGYNYEKVNFVSKLLVNFEFRFTDISLFGGPTLNVWVSEEQEQDFTPWTVYDKKHNGKYVRIWPGIILGLRF